MKISSLQVNASIDNSIVPVLFMKPFPEEIISQQFPDILDFTVSLPPLLLFFLNYRCRSCATSVSIGSVPYNPLILALCPVVFCKVLHLL